LVLLEIFEIFTLAKSLLEPGDSRRDFKKNPGHVCLASASYVMYQWISAGLNL